MEIKESKESINTLFSLNYRNFSCNDNFPCSFEEFIGKNDTNSLKFKNFDKWAKNVSDVNKKNCFVFEENKRGVYVVCLVNDAQVENAKKAAKNALGQKEISETADIEDNLENGVIFTGDFLMNNEKFFEKRAKIKQNEIVILGEEIGTNNEIDSLLKFNEIRAINNDACEILFTNFEIPEEFLKDNRNINKNCCLQTKVNEELLTLCVKKEEKEGKNENCEKFAKKLGKTIRNRCEILNNDNEDLNKETIDNHDQGIWHGWVQMALLNDLQEAKNHFLEINKEEISIRDNLKAIGKSKEIFKTAKLKWKCEDKNAFCGVKEFLEKEKREEEEENLKGKFKNLENIKHCFVIEFYENIKQRVICVVDLNQEENLKKAIENAFNLVEINADIREIPMAETGEIFDLSIDFHEDEIVKKKKIRINDPEEKMLEAETGDVVLNYNEISDFNNIHCGLEFRKITLPQQLNNIDKQCCFQFFFNGEKSEEKKNTICVNSIVRCVAKSRRLMKTAHDSCLRSKLKLGEITKPEFDKALKEYSLSNGEKGIKILGGGVDNGGNNNDPEKKEEDVWESKVFYKNLCKKKKLEESEEATLKIEKKEFIFSNIKDHHVELKFSILQIFLSCGEDKSEICNLKEFLINKRKEMKEMEYEHINKEIKRFLAANDFVDKSEYCSIIEFENPQLHFIDSFIICPTDFNKAMSLRKIAQKYLTEINPFEENEENIKELLPEINKKISYKFKIYLPFDGEIAEKEVFFDEFKIFGRSQQEILLKYENIDFDNAKNSCQVLQKPKGIKYVIENEEEENQGKDLNSSPVKIDCCFSAFYFQQEHIYCPLLKEDICKITKNKMINQIKSRCEIIKKKSLSLSNNTQNNSITQDDFNFEGSINKEPIGDYDTIELAKEMESDSVNGIWKGKVFTADITERNALESGFALEELFLNEKEMKFSAGNSSVKNYNRSKPLYELVWQCKKLENLCNPLQYIKAFSNIEADGIRDLTNTVNNLMKLLPDQDPSKCVVADYENPNQRTIKSFVII